MNEDKKSFQIPKINANDLEEAIFEGNLIRAIVLLLVPAAGFVGLSIVSGNETIWGNVFIILMLAVIVITTARYINEKAGGIIRYFPPCHDFLQNLKYCSRHRGFYVGLVIGSLLEITDFFVITEKIIHHHIPYWWSVLFLSAFIWSIVLTLYIECDSGVSGICSYQLR
ncbi:MAG: hypothetical protein DRO89_04875 [Candidatus Altiarchaeales archaeon]|nr:MAG: hypothetical protein DRO89_04875 [Candidatus Altiarchaeales archaeon]